MFKRLLICMVIFLFSTALTYAQTVRLPRTGQTTSYATGDDGALERGVAWPNPRFTDHGDGTVTDNLTGLMWTKNANLPGGRRTWQGALDYVAGMNAGAGTYGHTDWRLPNINELESLIHVGQSNPAAYLNNQGFTNVESYYYWSSSTYANFTDIAWIVTMYAGSVGANVKSINYYVWPVRAGQ